MGDRLCRCPLISKLVFDFIKTISNLVASDFVLQINVLFFRHLPRRLGVEFCRVFIIKKKKVED